MGIEIENRAETDRHFVSFRSEQAELQLLAIKQGELNREYFDARQTRFCSFRIIFDADLPVVDCEAVVKSRAVVAPVDAHAERERVAVTVACLNCQNV